MSSQEIGTALKYVSSSSEKHIYNGLVSIRKKLMKSKYAEKQLRNKGIISKLLHILHTQDLTQKENKLLDITLSILGNFCMEEEARSDVLKIGYGITCIADCVLESPCSSIQNRAARTLANLALSPLSIKRIVQSEVLPQLVKLLLECKVKESQLVYCRTLRLIGSNLYGKEKVLDENGLFAVAKLMSSDDDEVVKNSLRTVADLSVSGCSFKFARQILAAGIVNVMTDKVMNDNNTVSHNALSTLIRLAEYEYIRPVIGSAGGILLFINLLTDTRQHVDHIKILNVLCLCGKESVNRVKIRENGALEILLSALEGEKYARIHDRIISCFLSYLYDESSLNLLLDNKLINILLKHLQRCTEFKSRTITITFDEKMAVTEEMIMETKSDLILARPKQIPKRSKTRGKRKCELEINKDKLLSSPVSSKSQNMEDSSKGFVSMPVPTAELISSTITMRPEEASFTVTASSEVDSMTDISDIPSSSSISIEIPSTKDNRVYSIDSPTYCNHLWEPSPLSKGVTCKRSFSPVPSSSRGSSPTAVSSRSGSYSPLSNESYYSPGVSSPSYSIPSPDSPNMPYSTVWSQPYQSDSSDELSSLGTGVAAASYWTFSSSEEEEASNEDSNGSAAVTAAEVELKSEGNDQLLEETMVESDHSDEMSTFSDACSSLSLSEKKPESPCDTQVKRCGKHKRTSTSDNSDTNLETKRCKTTSKRLPASKITESNILILLSRVSVKNDPSPYLALPSVLCCMLDYIRDVPSAQSRCVRTISRILRDPMCLDSLLNIGAPVLIYQKLVLNGKGVDSSDVRSLLSKSKVRLSIDSNSSWTSPFSSPRQTSSDFSPDPTGKPWNFPTDPGSPTSPGSSSDYSVASPHFKKEEKEEPPIDYEQAGLELLRDLSFTAESPFGQGAITHTLLRKSKAERLSCCLSLQFLCWSSSMQDHFLVKHFTLSSLLEVIKEKHNHTMLPYIVSGLNFLARISNMKRKLTKESPVKFPKLVTDGEEKCWYWNCNHDVFFQVCDVQLGGNREILVKQSPVFAAMLEGHYCESNQSEISIQDTSHDAFLFILHYLHGCGLDCPMLMKYYNDSPDVEFWENALSLCDRYLCQSLTNFLIWVLASRYLTFDLFFHVFMYSAFHGFHPLTNECVRMLFSAEKPVILKVGIFKNIVQNKGADFLCTAIKSVFSEFIGKNFK
ncbi:hypothetical protein LOTGIDRAFT_228420 [Lottia gigantea]|uniref:BTB domain-containing protein n=1 Tax=Lottia gigantea TaxID=225164 RepID=V4A238_LOTGI|nr:hypothetical protein LOTGIDRAFT_228420 [Lottia gigantea]ESO97893.1 hypothetical protein LOTGIDRAFT_228420 [Lottia gigantea]